MGSLSTCPRIFIVILNYNSLEDTLLCVQCARRSTYGNCRLLVVDNASSDGSGTRLAEHIPSCELMRLPRNTGYAGGNNVGISIALKEQADYVLILNPDIRLRADAVEEYVRVMETHRDVGILSPIQLERLDGPVDDKFSQSILQRHGYSAAQALAFSPATVLEVSVVLGAAMMVRAETFRRVGGFDPLFFAYGEEEDVCRRARAQGFKIAVTPAAPVVHLRTNEKRAVSSRILFLRTKGAYLLDLKNPDVAFPIAVWRVFRRVFADLLLLKRERYPFRHYPVTRWHVLLSLAWLTVHLPLILLHRRAERAAGPYLFGL